MAIVANGIVLIDVDEKGHWTFHSDGKTADSLTQVCQMAFQICLVGDGLTSSFTLLK